MDGRMKFRIIQKPTFCNWSGEYEDVYFVQQKVWFWWKNVYTNLRSLDTAAILLDKLVLRETHRKNKPDKKVHKEIEV